jgi:nucleoside-diphosphate-sugar epimerase
MQRVLITGGAGFLGSRLTESFRNHGVAVRILDVAEAPGWAQTPGVEYVRGDVRDAGAVGAAAEGADTIVHAAFASPREAPAIVESVNVRGARQVCAQAVARGVRRMVLVSSTIVEGSARAHPRLLDAYRRSRIEAERVVSGCPGLRTAIVRPKTFLGPGRLSAFAIIFDWIRRGRPVVLMGDGRSRYQLLEIGDMAEGIRLLAGSEAEGVFYLGAREFGTLRDDLQALLDYAKTGARLRFIPAGVARAALATMELIGMTPPSELHYMSAGGRDSVADTSRAVEELGWQPRWSNAEALCRAYDWYVRSLEATGAAQATHPLPGSHRRLRKLIESILR